MSDSSALTDEVQRRIRAAHAWILRPAAAISTLAVATACVVAVPEAIAQRSVLYAGFSAAVLTVCALLWLTLGTRYGDHLRARPLATGAALGVAVALDPLHFMWAGRGLAADSGIILVLVAIGALLLDQRAATIVIVGCAGAWVVVADHAGRTEDRSDFIVTVALTVIVALGLNRVAVTTIGALETSRARLAALATSDALTGVANRRELQERGEAIIERSRLRQTGVSLLVIDIDDLKSVNDSAGHAAGDVLIQGVASALRDAIRGGDLVARTGGDEFAVLAPGVSGAAATAVADRLATAVDEAGHRVSIGVAWLDPVPALAPATVLLGDLIARADRAMYEHKNAGLGRR